MKLLRLLPSLLLFVCACILKADTLDPALQAKVDARLPEIRAWAADPALVDAVAAQNASRPEAHAAMTQEKWKSLSVLDPFVRGFGKNSAGAFLKSKKADWVSEAFLSDQRGDKVAFLAKPSNWCHGGKPKHDLPMKGEVWQGALELDESTGLQQVQVAVPVLKDGAPIGVLTVGLALSKLE